MCAKYYAIISKRGCWGSITQYQDFIVARVDGAKSREEALEAFRQTSKARREYEKQYAALPPSALSRTAREHVEQDIEEIICISG